MNGLQMPYARPPNAQSAMIKGFRKPNCQSNFDSGGAWCLMTEAIHDARTLLGGLVGQTIQTMTGKPNKILRLESENVVVATEKSPEGKPVPVTEVQAALDRLLKDRTIEISVSSVGYRSAFIGAALLTLPGSKMELRPRRIILEEAVLKNG